MSVQRYTTPEGRVRYRARVKHHGREVATRHARRSRRRILGHASAAKTMDLYGHLIDQNLWELGEAARGHLGGI